MNQWLALPPMREHQDTVLRYRTARLVLDPHCAQSRFYAISERSRMVLLW